MPSCFPDVAGAVRLPFMPGNPGTDAMGQTRTLDARHLELRPDSLPNIRPLLLGSEAIQEIPQFLFSPILFDASKDYHESETNCPETKHEWFCDRVNAFLSIREEPYYSLDVVRVNKLSICDFGLSQGN